MTATAVTGRTRLANLVREVLSKGRVTARGTVDLSDPLSMRILRLPRYSSVRFAFLNGETYLADRRRKGVWAYLAAVVAEVCGSDLAPVSYRIVQVDDPIARDMLVKVAEAAASKRYELGRHLAEELGEVLRRGGWSHLTYYLPHEEGG